MFGKKAIYDGYDKGEYERLKKMLEDRNIKYKSITRNSSNQIMTCMGNADLLREQSNRLNPDIQYELIVSKEDYKRLKKEGLIENRLR
ncbi:MAG: hypothetical protein Q4Q07_09535 [Tissierellia bacterium]|nr:hypothetical protein [Tissierellia bacterium]